MAKKNLKTFSTEKLLCEYVSKDKLWKKAREVGFIKRVRKVKPFSFLLSLIFSMDQKDGQSLASILRHLILTGKTSLVRSSFWDKMNESLEHLMRWVIARIQFETRANPPPYKGCLKRFKDVIALDCTVITLPDKLATVWPATRQNIEAAIKVFTEIRAVTGELLKNLIVPERTPDHRFCRVLKWQPGCLYLFDLGFVSGYAWQLIEKAEAYFISRMHSSTQPIITKCYGKTVSKKYRGKRLKEIAHNYAHQLIDVQCSFTVRQPGKDTKIGQVSSRVIGIWNKRTKRHQFYVTNVSWLDAKNFYQIYRLRWEVELFYKLGKSGLGLGGIKTSNPNKVKILVRAALIRGALALKAKIMAGSYLPVGRWINPLTWAKVIWQLFCPVLNSHSCILNDKVFTWYYLARLAMDPNKNRMPLRVKFSEGTLFEAKIA